MGGGKYQLGPLDVLVGIASIALAALAHYHLPFPMSVVADILLIVAVGGGLYFIHHKEDEEEKKRQEEENKRRWAELLGRDRGGDSR